MTNASESEDGTVLLSEVKENQIERYKSGPWDKNLGGGLTILSVVLLGGAPGAGKSTLALQLTNALAGATKREAFYVGAEEAAEQVKARAIRLGLSHLSLFRILAMDRMSGASIEGIMRARKPCVTVIDSMPGFTEDLNEMVQIAKYVKDVSTSEKIPVIIINHITKAQDQAGSMRLQHAVDTSLVLTKDDDFDIELGGVTYKSVRTLKTEKNRNGKDGEETFYAMTAKGLVQIEDPYDNEEEA